jgi:sugar lactone lactonase YvrE
MARTGPPNSGHSQSVAMGSRCAPLQPPAGEWVTTHSREQGAKGGATGNVIAVDPSGNVFVVEWPNEDVREITPAGMVSTFAGANGRFGGTDGSGATVASFANPQGIAIDGTGNIYVLDGSSNIRLIMPDAAVSTLVEADSVIYESGNNVVSSGSALTSIASSSEGILYTGGADSLDSGFSADIHKIIFK